jgi:diguanylate cyclase (GGDEF)-like protein
VDCEMVALTIADRRDGRHVVRAVHGADASIVGTEMLPGVGVTGRAIRDGRLVSTTQLRPPGGEVVAAGDARRASGAGTHDRGAVPVVALPILVDGRAMATLTLARRPGGRPFSDQEHGSLELIAGAIGLVLSNAELRMEMAESSLRDPLTGLSNRSFLDASLDQLLALRRRAEPGSQPPMAVILFDVDGFRRSNERYGRQTGDRILRAIGGVIRARFRASDTMARIGGDGFLVVLDGAGRDDAARAAAEVRARVRGLALTTARGEPLRVSVSAGCATFHDTDAGAQAIIRTVEAALDTARWSGTDAIVSI